MLIATGSLAVQFEGSLEPITSELEILSSILWIILGGDMPHATRRRKFPGIDTGQYMAFACI